jgi:hypothetical protein
MTHHRSASLGSTKSFTDDDVVTLAGQYVADNAGSRDIPLSADTGDDNIIRIVR